MAQGTLDEAARAMGGRVISGEPTAIWKGAAVDSRRVERGELFFALAGERTDGHRFADTALVAGAAAAVVSREVQVPSGSGLIRVPDTFEALHALTREVRGRLPRKLVGISGSAGKTTTKELLASMLSRRYRTDRSPGNLNNLYGFPLALLSVDEEAEWMVAEMGMSTPGELRGVSLLGRPDVAVLINVRLAHLEIFGSLRAIADAKAELLAGLAEGGLLVANRDDDEVARIARGYAGPVIWFGRGEGADYRVEEIESAAGGEGMRFTLHAAGERCAVTLALHGLYNVENFLAATACAHSVGVPLAAIVTAAAEARPARGRGELRRLDGDRLVIDDSYNSNPEALRLALASARALAGSRHWAVLGDMLELGAREIEYHRRSGSEAVALGFSPIVGVGPLARELVEAAAAEGAEAVWFPDADTAAGEVEPLRKGDVVLVKGSRGVGLETVVDRLVSGEGS